MKKKQKLFLVFTIILIMAIITIAGCKNEETVTFPSSFIGTWKRAGSVYTNTLTFTSNTIKDSSQNSIWNLTDASGDSYTISNSNDSSNTGAITIKLVGGRLVISNDTGTGQNNWNGTWTKQ
jgi:hypothetical protein